MCNWKFRWLKHLDNIGDFETLRIERKQSTQRLNGVEINHKIREWRQFKLDFQVG